jgi:putative DNA primase/helicase
MAGNGNKAVSGKRFSNLLQDLAVNQLKFKRIKKARDRYGSYFPDLVIRAGKYAALPRPITGELDDIPPDDTPPPGLPHCDGSVADCDGSVADCDGSVTAETIGSDGCDGCDGFLLVESNQEEIQNATSEQITESYGGESEKNPSHASHPAPISIPAVTNPSPNPSQPATSDDELKGWGEYHQRKPYPNPKSDNVRSSQKRALAIRQAYRAARTKEDLSALHREKGGEFSQDELNWVYNWLKIFFLAEFNHVQMTAKISQPGLL